MQYHEQEEASQVYQLWLLFEVSSNLLQDSARKMISLDGERRILFSLGSGRGPQGWWRTCCASSQLLECCRESPRPNTHPHFTFKMQNRNLSDADCWWKHKTWHPHYLSGWSRWLLTALVPVLDSPFMSDFLAGLVLYSWTDTHMWEHPRVKAGGIGHAECH